MTVSHARLHFADPPAPSSSYLVLQAYGLLMSFAFKMSSDLTGLLPYPLVLDRERVVPGCGSIMIRAGASLILHLIDSPVLAHAFSVLPGFTATLCFLAYATLSQFSLLHPDHDERSEPVGRALAALPEFRNILLSHPAAERVLAHIDRLQVAYEWRHFGQNGSERGEDAAQTQDTDLWDGLNLNWLCHWDTMDSFQLVPPL